MKTVVLLNVSLNYISRVDCLSRSLRIYIALPVVVFSRPLTSHAGILKMPPACIKWIWCFRSKMKTKMILRPLPHFQCSLKYSTVGA